MKHVSDPSAAYLRTLLDSATDDEATDDQIAQLTSKLTHLRGATLSDPAASRAAGSRPFRARLLAGATFVTVLIGASSWPVREASKPSALEVPEPSMLEVVPAPPVVSGEVHSAPSPPPISTPEAPARRTTKKFEVPTRQMSPAASVLPVPPSTASAGVEPMSEGRLLLLAHEAIVNNDPKRAKALVSEHESRFAQGALGEEREVIAIEGLVLEGRAEQAAARAARFHGAFPTSTYRNRVVRAVNSADRDK